MNETDWKIIFSRNVPCFDYLPRSSSLRESVQYVFNLVCDQAFSTTIPAQEAEQCWKLIFLLPWLLFQIPTKKEGMNPGRIITERVQKFLKYQFDELVSEAKQCSEVYNDHSHQRTPGDTDEKRRRRVKAEATKGNIGKAYDLLVSNAEVLDPCNEAVFERARQLFPDAHQMTGVVNLESVLNPLPPPVKVITPDDIKTALKESRRASAGPSGWVVAVIKTMLKSNACLANLAEFFNRLLTSKCPSSLEHLLGGGMATLLSKDNEGGIRPIIIREAFLRLLAKIIVNKEQNELAHGLAPLQAGVGLPGGIEFVSHSIRQLLQSNPSWIALRIDCKNAYGSIFRYKIDEVLRLMPLEKAELTLAYFHRYVLPPSRVFTRSFPSFAMNEGIIQGDPLSPLLFSLAFQHALKKAQAVLTSAPADQPVYLVNGQVFSYLDDAIIVGPMDQVFNAYETFKDCAHRLGLRVAIPKCEILTMAPHDDPVPDLQQHPVLAALQPHMAKTGITLVSSAIKILGTFLGSGPLEELATHQSITSAGYQRVMDVDNKQISLLLLRECIGKATNHIARILPPSSSQKALQLHDSRTMQVAKFILEMTPEENVDLGLFMELGLPLKYGGLGLTNLATSSHIAYLSSVVSVIHTWKRYINPKHPFLTNWITPPATSASTTRGTIELQRALSQTWELIDSFNNMNRNYRRSSKTVPALPKTVDQLIKLDKVKFMQSTLMSIKAEYDKTSFYDRYLTRAEERAQFISKNGFGAAGFLQTVPSETGLAMSDRRFTIALRLRFRLPIIPFMGVEYVMPCYCKRSTSQASTVMCTEEHLLNCNGSSMLSQRHNYIRDVISKMMVSVGLFPTTEPLCAPGSGEVKRFDIGCDRATDNGLNLKLDVSISNPNAAGVPKEAAYKSLVAANLSVRNKNKLYAQFLNPCDKFMVLAFETYGAMHPNIQELITIMAYRVYHAAPMNAAWTAPTFTQYWTQRLSVALQDLLASNIENTIKQSYDMSMINQRINIAP